MFHPGFLFNSPVTVNVIRDGIPAPVPIMINYTFHAWREAPKTIDALAAYNSGSFTVTTGGEPERL